MQWTCGSCRGRFSKETTRELISEGEQDVLDIERSNDKGPSSEGDSGT